MDERTVAVLVGQAGLQLALERFRDDVLAAIADAEALRKSLNASPPPAAEPWPAMHVGQRR